MRASSRSPRRAGAGSTSRSRTRSPFRRAGSCGPLAADRARLTLVRVKREFVVLTSLVALLTTCTSTYRATSVAQPSVTPPSQHRLTSAPTDCVATGDPLVQHVPPWGQVLGDSPAWMYVSDAFDVSIGALHVRARHKEHGWQMKALWLLPADAPMTVRVTGVNASTGSTMWFEPAGSQAGVEMSLDPAHPGAVPTGHRWLPFPTAMSFPGSGCYTIQAQAGDDEWSTTIGIGR
jgi:hypothetical protein